MTGVASAMPAMSGSAGSPPPVAEDRVDVPSTTFLQVLFLMGGELPSLEESDPIETKDATTGLDDSGVNPTVVADAVIRSMLRLEAIPSHAPVTAHSQTLGMPTQSPVQSMEAGEASDTESNMVAASTGCEPTHPASAASPRALPKTPVAFALRLTPHEHPGKESSIDRTPIPWASRGSQEPKELFSETLEETAKGPLPERSLPVALPLAQGNIVPVVHGTVMPVSVPQSLPTPPSFETPGADLQPPQPSHVEEREMAARPAPTHDIAVRVSAPDQPDVDLHVAQRGGEIQVAVRASDPVLRAALQNEVNALVGKLEHAGFHTEKIVTHETPHDSQDTNSGHNSHPGDSPARQHQHQQRRQKPQAQWIETLEDTHDYRRN